MPAPGCASASATSASSHPATGIVSLFRNTRSCRPLRGRRRCRRPRSPRSRPGARSGAVPESGQHLRRLVLRCVVDDDQLERDRGRLAHDGVHALAREPGAVVDRDDDRAARAAHDCFPFSAKMTQCPLAHDRLVALLEVLGEAAVVLEPPHAGAREHDELAAGRAHRLQRRDGLFAVGGMMTGPRAVRRSGEVACVMALDPQQLLVTLAHHQHGRARRQRRRRSPGCAA